MSNRFITGAGVDSAVR